MNKVFLLAIFILVLPAAYSIQLSCHVRANCYAPDWFPVFSMRGPKNAHIGLWDEVAPNEYFACCNATRLVNPTHESIPFLWVENNGNVNSHAWSYNETLTMVGIQFNSSSPIACEVQNHTLDGGLCSAGWTTIASMIGPNNTHVGNISDYDYKICCKKLCMGESDTCGYVGDSCCQTNLFGISLHCDAGQNNNLPYYDKHCCPAGTYWNNETKQCEEARECAYNPPIVDPDLCDADIIDNPQSWFNDLSNCTEMLPLPLEKGCCLVNRYGKYDYYMENVYVYPLS